jgi:transcription termination factor Rho
VRPASYRDAIPASQPQAIARKVMTGTIPVADTEAAGKDPVNDSNLLEDRSGDSAGGTSASIVPAGLVTDEARTDASSTRPARRRASRPVGADASDTATAVSADTTPAKSGGSLAAKLLPELQQIAGSLGIAGAGRLRKGQLISAIQEARAGSAPTTSVRAPQTSSVSDRADSPSNGVARVDQADSVSAAPDEAPRAERPANDRAGNDRARNDRARARHDRNSNAGPDNGERGPGENAADGERGRPDRPQNDRNQNDRNQNQGGQGNSPNRNQGNNSQHDDDDGGQRSRRGRYRDRRRGRDRQGGPVGQGGQSSFPNDPEPQIREDDVLVPVAGILDTADNYAFLRTSGYLSGPNDVYVSMNLVRRHGLRRGDALTGQVKANVSESEHQGNRREKYVPLARLDTVNGLSIEEAKKRPEFQKLVPLYPQERLRLETEPTDLVTRVIDLVMPIGKGQRALIVSPPKAGKTTVLQRIANAITVNNPECHLMVVLVDERPEEVTDMQRSVKGEVIASTFDRPAQDHTTIAELSIERAKRLVEQGHDVVVLLDSITRLGRAYNLAAPASGRILSGGVDSTALYPPKRFLGAARNIENGGSLTIIATALVETGSMMDTVIFEEFKGTGNAELKLDRKIADKRVFPAVDIDPSGTRKEELLMSPEEMAIVHKLRRVLHALDSQQAIDLLVTKLKETRTNIEFLMQIAKTTPGE